MRMHRKVFSKRLLIIGLTTILMGISGCSGTTTTLTATQLAVTSSAATVNINGSVTLTATLSPGSSASAPIGVITFFAGGASLQAVAVTGTSATATISTLALGANAITASYSGDQTHAASTSQAITVTVFQPTATLVSGTPAIAGQNEPVTLTANVTAGTNVASGTVNFFFGSTNLGSGALASPAAGSGQTASIVVSTLPLGSDSVTATYVASGSYLTSTSAPFTVKVVSFTPTSTALTLSPAGTIAAGTDVTLTATIAPTANKGAVTGTVSFFDGAVALGTVPVSTNQAILISKQFSVGSGNSLTAVYSGDPIYGGSTSSATPLTMTAYSGATYTNPLTLTDTVNNTGAVYNCPDPAIIKYQIGGADTWYAYCTGDAFNAADTVTNGGAFRAHLISIFNSTDLVNWTYVRDAFTSLPSWVASGNELQTPAIKLIGGKYYLYYEAPAVTASPNGSAIGVGVAATPAGPFTDSGGPVVSQQIACGGSCNRTVFSPEIIADQSGNYWIAYGGIYAGLSIRELGPDFISSIASTEINIAVDNYYTNPYMLYKNGYFYEFATPAGTCCSGAYSTDSVRVGRSASITGPYLDAEGNDMNAYSTPATVAAPGGDTVLVNTGNDIVGPGSNSVFTDEAGQDYILYSGVSQKQQYLPTVTGYTARQLMMDPLDWVNGWPVTRAGNGPSDYTTPQPLPAAQPNATNGYVPSPWTPDAPGTLIAASSDDFNTTTLSSQWTFLHETAPYTLTGTAYSVVSNYADSTVTAAGYTMAQLPILSEPEPAGNYLLEVKVHSMVPATGCCGYNYSSQGLMIYSTDATYLRLDEFADYDTRQIEYLDQFGSTSNLAFAPVGTPNYAGYTYLRLVKRANSNGSSTYTSYSSVDGITYLRGPAWVVNYGSTAKIGLWVGNTGYGGVYDYVHVYTLTP